MKIVEIDWVDSMGDFGWRSQKEALDNARAENALLHHSIGYVIEQTDEYILLAGSVGHNGEEGRMLNGVIQIPRCAVLAIREIFMTQEDAPSI